MPKARLIVISAPSGGGKTTIAGEILRRHPSLVFSVSATTRPKREYEVNGVDYHFLTREEFQRRVDEGQFVEFEELVGQMYGTLRKETDAALSSGKSMLFDVDVKGALSIKKLYGDTAVLVFVKPPDVGALLARVQPAHRGPRGAGCSKITLTRAAALTRRLNSAVAPMLNRLISGLNFCIG